MSGAVLIGAEIYRKPGFGKNHPLAIPRVGLVMETCEAMGWVNSDYRESPKATIAQITRFHDSAYVEAVARVSAAGKAETADREKYQLGTMENPVFEGLMDRALTTCGGSIMAAEIALDGGVAFNPAGGTHHGMPDHAHGFCYFNDPVMAILTLLEKGTGDVLYLDLDAHHGDGVEQAFAAEPRVTTVSIHEAGRWPGTGQAHGPAGSGIYNFAVPRAFNDVELKCLMDEVVLPILEETAPACAVITCGADALVGDPLSSMALSNVALWDAVLQITSRVPGTAVLGGGGYNPWTVARCWAGLWGRLSGRSPPWPLPPEVAARYREIECDLVDEDDQLSVWFERIDDLPAACEVRSAVRELVAPVAQKSREVV